MNRRELINEITERIPDRSRREVSDVITVFEDLITDALCDGDPVNLSGFVKFSRKDTPAKPAREGRNPATGETMMLKPKPASVAVKVTPLKALKDTVIEASAKAARKAKKSKKK